MNYVLSPERNEGQSSEAGRAKNTSDGNNHWRESCGPWVDPKGAATFGWSLNCRHVAVWVPATDIHQDIVTAKAGEPIRRRIRGVSSQHERLVPLASVVLDQ